MFGFEPEGILLEVLKGRVDFFSSRGEEGTVFKSGAIVMSLLRSLEGEDEIGLNIFCRMP